MAKKLQKERVKYLLSQFCSFFGHNSASFQNFAKRIFTGFPPTLLLHLHPICTNVLFHANVHIVYKCKTAVLVFRKCETFHIRQWQIGAWLQGLQLEGNQSAAVCKQYTQAII